MTAFFFAPESGRSLAAVRIVLALTLLGDALYRLPHTAELYSSASTPLPLFRGTDWIPPVPSPFIAHLLTALLLFGLLGMLAGWRTRWSLLLAFIPFLWLGLLDQPGTFKKSSAVAWHLLLLLLVSRCDAKWSLDSFARSRDRCRLAPAWPRRLMQILVMSIYWGAALTKIRLPDFGSGDLLMFSLLDDRWGGGWLAQWLSLHPPLLSVISLGTIFFEMLFPVLVWQRRLRRPMLLLAFLFHLGMLLTLTIGPFAPVMWSALLAFVEDEDWDSLTRRAGYVSALFVNWGKNRELTHPARLNPIATRDSLSPAQLRWVPPLLLSLTAMLLTLWLSTGQGNGEYARVPPETIQEILLREPLPVSDYFHRSDLGSRVANQHVHGERETFHPGEIVYLHGRLLQEHPALELELRLTAPDGGTFIHPLTVAANTTHVLIPVRFTSDHPPGEYQLELHGTRDAWVDEWELIVQRTVDLRERRL